METFSALLVLCAGNSPVTGEFPSQRPVTRSFDVFFDLRPNKRLSKHSWGWWFETSSRSLWRHCNVSMTPNRISSNGAGFHLNNHRHMFLYLHYPVHLHLSGAVWKMMCTEQGVMEWLWTDIITLLYRNFHVAYFNTTYYRMLQIFVPR